MAETNVMSAEDFAIVKLAAAERYRERNVRPETAAYLFERRMRKEAQTKAQAFGAANRGRSPLQAAVNVDDNGIPQPVGSGSRAGLGGIISKGVKGMTGMMGKTKLPPKQASAPNMPKIIKLAASLKRVLPAKA